MLIGVPGVASDGRAVLRFRQRALLSSELLPTPAAPRDCLIGHGPWTIAEGGAAGHSTKGEEG